MIRRFSQCLSRFSIILLLPTVLLQAGCNSNEMVDTTLMPKKGQELPEEGPPLIEAKPTVTPKPNSSPSPSPIPSPSPPPETAATDALIYWGKGADPSNAESLVDLIRAHGLTYKTVTSAQLNAMTSAQLANFGVIVWPGGYSEDMNSSLTGATRNRIRQAIREDGVGYTGFCAGAWLAVGPNPKTSAPAWGIAAVTGNYLQYFYPNGKNPVAAMVPTHFADGSVRDLVWWGGPYLPSIANSVIAKYVDGKAAMIQSWAGKGFVTLSGPHPEAPQSWRDSEALEDRDGLDLDLAWDLIEAAWKKTPLRVF